METSLTPEPFQLLTIGYAEPDAQERIGAFLRQEQALLVDIRTMPRSRYYWQFNAQRLRGLYPGRYIHLPALGNVNYRPADRAKGIVLADPTVGVKQVLSLLEQGHVLMLLCACQDYERCHRKTVHDLVMAPLASLGAGTERK